MSPVNITKHNVGILEVLVNNCFPITYTQEFYEKVSEKFAKFSRLFYYQDVPLGGLVAKMTTKEDEKNGYEADNIHLMIILVLQNYRRRGIASQILAFLESEIAKEKISVKTIFLHVLKDNQPAIEFYKLNGFEITDEIENYYTMKDGSKKSALKMAKFLTKNN